MATGERVDRVDYGDPLAPPGTPPWAKRWALEAAVKVPGIELEPLNVESHIELGRKFRAWTMVSGPDGQPFESFDDFCEAPKPYGCDFPAAKVKAILSALHGARAVNGLRMDTAKPTAEPKPPPKHVGPGRGRKNAGYQVTGVSDRGNRADYIAGRIKAKAAKGDETAARVVADVEAGKYDSMRAAARDAGVLKPADPVKVAARALRKVPDDRKHELLSGDVRGLQMAIRKLTAEEQVKLYEWLGKELQRC